MLHRLAACVMTIDDCTTCDTQPLPHEEVVALVAAIEEEANA